MHGRSYLTGAMLVVALMAPAYPEDQQRLSFHIPSQPLDLALQAYSRASGVQVLYESEVAVGRRSAPIDGALTPEAALRALLAGTDLVVRYTSANAITLSRWPDQPDRPGGDDPPTRGPGTIDLTLDPLRVIAPDPTGDAALREYNQAIRVDIERALHNNPATRSGTYRVSVRLWIDPSRTVQRAELSQSTGDQQRDAAVAGVLQNLLISRSAPANLPQPVRIAIVVKSL